MKKVIIFIILSLIFVGLSVYKEFNDVKVLYIGHNTQFYVKNNKIIRKTDSLKKSYSKAKILFNNSFIDGYMFVEDSDFGKEIKMYDKNKNQIIRNNGVLLFRGNMNISIPNYTKYNTYNKSEEDSIKKILEENDIVGNISSYKKFTIDIDNDGEKDELYSLIVFDDTTVTSIIYMNDSILLNESDSISKAPSISTYSIDMIIDINNDNEYEIVVSNLTGDDNPTYSDIYTYKNNSFIKVGD